MAAVVPPTDTEVKIRDDTLRYIERTVGLLHELLLQVIRRRAPEIMPVLEDQEAISPSTRLRVLQADGIWFQLFNIAEQNAAIRRRRAIETESGAEAVPGSWAAVLTQAQQAGLSAGEVQERLHNTCVIPVLTAHPTEAKRVTVLEIHRRIYVQLKELEEIRYTQRERDKIIRNIRDEIDLLWMTGEIRLTKPTVDEEVSWILHFFNESLYHGVRDLFWQLSQALQERYPDASFGLPPLLRFGCWVGGDRDGNPHVTAETTRDALDNYRRMALQHLRRRVIETRSRLSIAAHTITVPETFAQRLEQMLTEHEDADAIRKRNPQEVFRQYLNLIIRRLEATQENTPERYRRARDLVDDLQAMEHGLHEADCQEISEDLVLPLRLEAQIFGFHTAHLDIRENNTMTNNTLAALYQHLESSPAPELNSPEWKEWLLQRLAEPISELPQFEFEEPEARRTMELFCLLGKVLEGRGLEPLGAFILSMTHTEADLLGVYLLAKYGGLFSDRENCETCRLPVVPLLETIDDLRRGPTLLRELLQIPLVRRSVRASGGVQEGMVG